MRGTPDAAELFKLALRENRRSLRTAMPGIVTKVHSGAKRKGQWVDVRPQLKIALRDEDGALVEEELPVIPLVPVQTLHAGGWLVSVPIAVGDIVTLQFCERSLDQWVQKAKPGDQRAYSVGHQEMHGLNGAIAVPGGPASLKGVLESVSATDMVIGRDGSAGGSQALIRLRPDGSVDIDAPAGLKVNGSIEATGEITAKSDGAESVTVTGHATASPFGPLTVTPGT